MMDPKISHFYKKQNFRYLESVAVSTAKALANGSLTAKREKSFLQNAQNKVETIFWWKFK